MSQQLVLPLVTEKDSEKVSVTNSVTETKIKYLERFCRRDNDPTPHVEEYQSGRRSKQTYFRVSWRDGYRIKHYHIPGGNINSELAVYRAKKIQQMIDRGAELGEVIAAVKTYRGTKP